MYAQNIIVELLAWDREDKKKKNHTGYLKVLNKEMCFNKIFYKIRDKAFITMFDSYFLFVFSFYTKGTGAKLLMVPSWDSQ